MRRPIKNGSIWVLVAQINDHLGSVEVLLERLLPPLKAGDVLGGLAERLLGFEFGVLLVLRKRLQELDLQKILGLYGIVKLGL